MTKTGQMPESWEEKLTTFLGTPRWKQALYSMTITRDLFGTVEETSVRAGVDKVAAFLQERLESCFPGVASNPRPLFNSKNCPLYLQSYVPATAASAVPARLTRSQ